VNAEGDFPESLGSVEQGVHGSKDGEENLGGTDVAGGAVAADVLFAGLEGKAVGGAAGGVFGDADEAAGEEALVGELGGEVGGVGAAEADGDAEALGVADGDIGAEFARRGEKEKGEGIGDDDGEGAGVADLFQRGTEVVNAAVGFRVGENAGEEFRGEVGGEVGRFMNFPTEDGGAGVDDGGGGGVEAGGDPEGVAFRLVDGGVGKEDGLSSGGALVEEGGVGDLHPGEFEDHGLEVEEGFEAALRDLGLIRGVGTVPAGILDDVAAEHRGRDGAVVAESDEGAAGLVLGEDFFEFRQGGGFGGGGGGVGGGGGREAGWKGRLDEILKGFEAKEAEHLLLVFFGRAEMAGEKGEIFDNWSGSSGLGGGRGLFRCGGCEDRHFWKNKEGQGVGKGGGKVGRKGMGGVSLKRCMRG